MAAKFKVLTHGDGLLRSSVTYARVRDGARIELELASGRSNRKVAAEFGVARDSVRRHWLGHVTSVRKAELIGGPVAVARLAKRAAEEDRSADPFQCAVRPR
jgi:hypothetical protein